MQNTILDFFGPLSPLIWFLLLFVAAGIGIELLGLVGTLRFRFRRMPTLKEGEKVPGVSIIKPCFKAMDNERENFDTFFRQDYEGPIEMLFVVNTDDDPIVPVIREYLERYPKFDARIIICHTNKALWNKVNSLYDGQCEAKHEVIIWSDSDVIVKPNYVRQMVACLQEPGVSLVTTPQYDTRANTFGSAFKVLANNADVATFVMGYGLLPKRKFVAWGHSSGFWKKEFDSFKEKAWDLLNRHVADDLALPLIFNRQGKRVEFRNIYCPVETSNKTARQMINQKKRWVICQKIFIGNPYVYLSGVLFYPQVPAFLLLLATGFSGWAWTLFFAVGLSRIAISTLWEWLFLDSIRMNSKYFWTIMLWDLSQMYFFVYGFITEEISFNGIKYKIFDRIYLKPLDASVDGTPAELVSIPEKGN